MWLVTFILCTFEEIVTTAPRVPAAVAARRCIKLRLNVKQFYRHIFNNNNLECAVALEH